MTKIRIQIADKEIIATLNDSPTARDSLAILPLNVSLNDFNNTEKICELPKRLSTDGGTNGYQPVSGDITYYAPWGNLAIFYQDFKFSPGLISLGKIDSGIERLTSPVTAVIERAN